MDCVIPERDQCFKVYKSRELSKGRPLRYKNEILFLYSILLIQSLVGTLLPAFLFSHSSLSNSSFTSPWTPSPTTKPRYRIEHASASPMGVRHKTWPYRN